MGVDESIGELGAAMIVYVTGGIFVLLALVISFPLGIILFFLWLLLIVSHRRNVAVRKAARQMQLQMQQRIKKISLSIGGQHAQK